MKTTLMGRGTMAQLPAPVELAIHLHVEPHREKERL